MVIYRQPITSAIAPGFTCHHLRDKRMNSPAQTPHSPEPISAAKNDAESLNLISSIFFNLSADLFCIIGADGYFKRVNPAWTGVLGWNPEELRSHQWSELVHPEDREFSIVKPPTPEKADVACKNRYRQKNGTYRWISWKASHYKDGLIYAVGRDITEQQELEAAARQREQQYRTLVETSRDLIWSVDLAGNWTFVNPAMKEIYGYEPHEAIGRSFLEFMTPEQREKDAKVFEGIKAGESCFRYETMHQRKDGTPVYLSYNAVVLRDSQGNIIGTTGTATDITQRKHYEAQLRQSQQKLEIHLEKTPLAAIEWNLNFEVSNWNRAAESIFGYRAEEAIGRHALDLLAPEHAKVEINDILQALLNQQGGIYSTNENVTKDGRIIICEWHNTPLVNAAGEMVGVASLVQDVTDRIQTHRALEQSQKRFQKLADNLPGMVYQYLMRSDGSSAFPYVSSGCRELLELEPEYIREHPDAAIALIHPDDLSAYYDSLAISMATLQPWRWEGRFILPSGTLKWLQSAARPERQANGDLLWEGVVLDITERKQAQDAVARSEAKWRALIQNSSDLIVILDAEGVIRYHSPSTERILGYSSSSLLGENAAAFIHPEDLDNVAQAYEEVCRHPQATVKIEYRVRHVEGYWLFLESIAANLLEEPAVAGLAVNSRDITERKHAEEALIYANVELEHRVESRTVELRSSLAQLRQEIIARSSMENALRENEQRFRAIFQNAAIGIAVSSLDGHLLDCNPALQAMWGYSKRELLGKPLEELSDPQEWSTENKLAEEMLSGGAPGYGMEKRYRCKDGRVIWGRLSVSLVRDRTGEPQFAIGMVEDITARKQAEMELMLTRKAVESSSDAISIADRTGRHIYHNQAFSQLFEYHTPEELNAAGGPQVLYVDAAIGAQVFDRIMAGESWSGEVIMRGKSDRILQVLLRADAIKDPSGQIVGLIGISTDISQRIRAEEQIKHALHAAEAANRAKSTFLANMSHELRTPLNAIIGYSEILTEEMEDLGAADLIPDLHKIRTAGKHLLALINDILDISKIEAGRMTLYLERFEVKLLLQEIINTVQPLVQKNRNSLILTCEESVETMYADLMKVRQILLNLLSNAAKFTQNGRITIEVTQEDNREPSSPGESLVRFRVTDTGLGISVEQMETIFQAFQQADLSTTRQYGGTGLGLAIARRFCEMMGGKISVQSQVGEGSTFTVELPMEVKESSTDSS
ncbi:PAS domain S-box protein [Phormidium sp. CCY1219]|uniref:PAS domain S-box protein n=1 Tax=Phormidium sp. CCY1219 TaxID=2886104 RepID=UPI002D1E6FDE|nr:PAS domain S-box protein [Phormidium sp. CCY1219]MEB3826251.1 PAS domain S-box protein [Phormidium sp. CCY1219]